MTTHAELIETLGDEKVHYYSWDKHGYGEIFEQIGEAELSFEHYEFHLVGVFRHIESGLLFTGDDAGCSCPTPWESVRVKDLEPLKTYQDWLDYSAELLGPTPEELDARKAAGEDVWDWQYSEAERVRPKRLDELEGLRVEVEKAFKDLKRKQVLADIVEDRRDALDQLD